MPALTNPTNSYASNLVTDVTITGETVGANRTTIAGGVSPIYEAFTNAKASISGIKFVNPQWCAFNILRSTGITIANCEVAGVLPFLNGSGYTESSGIYLYGPGTIAGNVTISGTYIHGLDGQYEYGIKSYAVSTTTNLVGNTIQVGNAADATAGTVDCEGIAIGACPGTTNITGNNVQVGPGIGYEGIAVYGPSTGAATIVGNEVTVNASAITHEAIGINGSVGRSRDPRQLHRLRELVRGRCRPRRRPLSRHSLKRDGGPQCDQHRQLLLWRRRPVRGGDEVLDLAESHLGQFLLRRERERRRRRSRQNIISSNSFLSNLFLGYTATSATLFFDTNTQNNVWRGPYTSAINDGTGNSISKSLF